MMRDVHTRVYSGAAVPAIILLEPGVEADP